MSLVVSHTENEVIRFTYTKESTRLKLSNKPSTFNLEDTIKFAELVQTYIDTCNINISLRGQITENNNLYVVELYDSNHTKHLYYKFTGNKNKLINIEEFERE